MTTSCKQMGELRREDLRRAKIVAKLQMQLDKKRQNCRLLKNLRAERPMETQMAADVFRRCAKDLQSLYVQEYELLRRWRRKMFAGMRHLL